MQRCMKTSGFCFERKDRMCTSIRIDMKGRDPAESRQYACIVKTVSDDDRRDRCLGEMRSAYRESGPQNVITQPRSSMERTSAF